MKRGSQVARRASNGRSARPMGQNNGAVRSAERVGSAVTPRGLEAIPLFRGLDVAHLETLSELFRTECYDTRQVIVREGDVGRDLYLLASGSVEVVKQRPEGNSARLAVLNSGDFFGEIALLDATTRTATVRALTACVLYCLDGSQLEALMKVAPCLRSNIERAARERLQRAA